METTLENTDEVQEEEEDGRVIEPKILTLGTYLWRSPTSPSHRRAREEHHLRTVETYLRLIGLINVKCDDFNVEAFRSGLKVEFQYQELGSPSYRIVKHFKIWVRGAKKNIKVLRRLSNMTAREREEFWSRADNYYQREQLRRFTDEFEVQTGKTTFNLTDHKY